MKVTGTLIGLQINEDRPGDSCRILVDEPDKEVRIVSIYGMSPEEVRSLSSHLGYTVSFEVKPDSQ
jgi:hypothetical protein